MIPVSAMALGLSLLLPRTLEQFQMDDIQLQSKDGFSDEENRLLASDEDALAR